MEPVALDHADYDGRRFRTRTHDTDRRQTRPRVHAGGIAGLNAGGRGTDAAPVPRDDGPFSDRRRRVSFTPPQGSRCPRKRHPTRWRCDYGACIAARHAAKRARPPEHLPADGRTAVTPASKTTQLSANARKCRVARSFPLGSTPTRTIITGRRTFWKSRLSSLIEAFRSSRVKRAGPGSEASYVRLDRKCAPSVSTPTKSTFAA